MNNQITLYKQIHPCQCQAIAKMGYKTLINLCDSNEREGQPCNLEIAKSAATHGLDYHNLPIDGESTLSYDTVTAFAKILNQSQKPVMVFCATGGRAKRLYQSAIVSGLIA